MQNPSFSSDIVEAASYASARENSYPQVRWCDSKYSLSSWVVTFMLLMWFATLISLKRMRDWGEGLLGRAVIKCCNPKHLLWLSSLDVIVDDVMGYQNGRLKVTLCDMLNLQLLQLLQNLMTALIVVYASTDTSKLFQQFILQDSNNHYLSIY